MSPAWLFTYVEARARLLLIAVGAAPTPTGGLAGAPRGGVLPPLPFPRPGRRTTMEPGRGGSGGASAPKLTTCS